MKNYYVTFLDVPVIFKVVVFPTYKVCFVLLILTLLAASTFVAGNTINNITKSTYGEESSDFGRVRKLSEKELEKYLPLFKKISNEIISENLRYVDFCWYNCCEATDYFYESQDDFYDEI